MDFDQFRGTALMSVTSGMAPATDGGILETMGVWDLLATGRLGQLALGMRLADVRSVYGEPDDWAGDPRDPSILKYDEIELHFFDGALRLVHAELRADGPNAFESSSLGIAAHELVWPLALAQLGAVAEARGLTATHDTDGLGRPRLIIGHATLTEADDVLAISIGPQAAT